MRSILGRLRRELALALMAVQFLTRLPCPSWVGHDPVSTGRAVRYFPIVGALVGAAGAGIAIAAHQFWPDPVAAALSIVTTIWLTSALHEDGLADTFDALLGAAPRERALAIMKDSRIGTYGAAALGASLLLRVLAFSALLTRDVRAAAAAAVGAHAAGRALAVALTKTLPYGGEHAVARAGATARESRTADVACSTALGVLVLALTCVPQTAPLTKFLETSGGLILLAAVLRRWLRRRIGGYTGDTLGAAEQLGELVVLLAFAARLSQ